MNRRVNKIRQSINSRKKKRYHAQTKEVDYAYLTPDLEEKHGFPPEISSHVYEKKQQTVKKQVLSNFLLQGILAATLFLLTAIVIESDNPSLEKVQEVTGSMLQEEFPFAKVNSWYQNLFGHPLSLGANIAQENVVKNDFSLPVQGTISESFQVNGKGVKITAQTKSDVYSHQDGVVIFSGNKPDTNKTIIVQHADGTNSLYGHLTEVEVHLYQFVSQNQRIGNFIPNEQNQAVYFSLEKDNDFLDPVQVIEVDDVP